MHHNNNSLQFPRDSIKSTVPKSDQKFDRSKLGQTVQITQSMNSLQTETKFNRKFDRLNLTDQSKVDQTAQKEHQGVTKALQAETKFDWKFDQSKVDQTAQKEHRGVTKALQAETKFDQSKVNQTTQEEH